MPTPPPTLAFGLLRGADWFNDALLVQLEQRGWPRLNRTQSLTFANLDAAARPADLARQVGISRQSMHTLLADLAGLGLVRVVNDQADRRAKLVELTPDGKRLVEDAGAILRDLEATLARRIGAAAVRNLRAALAADWRTPLAASRSDPRDG